jgi:serine/threonine-protein kinase RsbW
MRAVQSRFQQTLAAELQSLPAFRDLIEAVCQEHPAIDPHTCYDLKLAVEEACSNVITHGYAGMNPGSLMVTLCLSDTQVEVTITDFGHPFEPYEPEAPDLELSLSEGLTGGFGLFLIYQTMDEVGYQTGEDGNHLTFVKRLPASR